MQAPTPTTGTTDDTSRYQLLMASSEQTQPATVHCVCADAVVQWALSSSFRSSFRIGRRWAHQLLSLSLTLLLERGCSLLCVAAQAAPSFSVFVDVCCLQPSSDIIIQLWAITRHRCNDSDERDAHQGGSTVKYNGVFSTDSTEH